MDEREAGIICSLPLSRKGYEDKLVLGPNKKGSFLVRSAYYLAVDMKQTMQGEQS